MKLRNKKTGEIVTKIDVSQDHERMTNELFEVAERVIKGEYGNGLYRIKMLEMDGYDSARVQNIVNVMLMERKK